MLIASAPTKKALESLINNYFYSFHYFINNDDRAENKKTGKILGEIIVKKKRFQFHL